MKIFNNLLQSPDRDSRTTASGDADGDGAIPKLVTALCEVCRPVLHELQPDREGSSGKAEACSTSPVSPVDRPSHRGHNATDLGPHSLLCLNSMSHTRRINIANVFREDDR